MIFGLFSSANTMWLPPPLICKLLPPLLFPFKMLLLPFVKLPVVPPLAIIILDFLVFLSFSYVRLVFIVTGRLLELVVLFLLFKLLLTLLLLLLLFVSLKVILSWLLDVFALCRFTQLFLSVGKLYKCSPKCCYLS